MVWRLIAISWRSRHPVLSGIGAAVGAAIGFAIFSNLYGFTMPTHPRHRHCHHSKHYHRQLRFKGHRTRSSFRVRLSHRGTNPSQWRWTSWAGWPTWHRVRMGPPVAVNGGLPHDGSRGSGTMARTVVPRSLDSISSSPPTWPRRSRMPAMPTPTGTLISLLP